MKRFVSLLMALFPVSYTHLANYHLPIGVFGAGLWGGVMRD